MTLPPRVTPLDRADGRYFHKTIGIPPRNSPEERICAAAYIARRCQDASDFTYLTDALGLCEAATGLRRVYGNRL